MILKSSRFDNLIVIQLLQNIHDYFLDLSSNDLCYDLGYSLFLELYLKCNIERLFLKWPKSFPNIIFVLERVEEDDPFFIPASSNNERHYYNILTHYGQKKRFKQKRILYFYTF